MMYTGQIAEMLVPIREDGHDQNLDMERANAIHRFRDLPRLQVDQGAYMSNTIGMCHLVFVLQNKCSKLQIQLYNTCDSDHLNRVLKMNREVNLSEIGIIKASALQNVYHTHVRTNVDQEFSL
jgi:hypothetical protein